MAEPPQDPTDPEDPRREPIYRAILAVLALSVVAGALLALTGESLFESRALANAGFGMGVVCLVLYWVFRLLGRRAARRQQGRAGDRDGEPD